MKHLTAALLAFAVMGGAVQAATVFEDNFDKVGKGKKENFNNFPQFDVAQGSVDYIYTGLYKLTCAGGSYGCVDLDGTTGTAGTLLSHEFEITAGTSYSVSFDLAGNGRNKSSDSVVFGITNDLFGVAGNMFDGAIDDIAWDKPFATYVYDFVAPTSGMYSFFIGALGGDYFGPLLDNVKITSVDITTPVPVPATLPLLAGALGGLAFLRRRKA